MSFYTDGTQAEEQLPSAWPVPGVIDTTLIVTKNIEIPNGKSIDLHKYSDVAEPALAQTTGIGVPSKPLKLGDEDHFDMNNLLKHLKQPQHRNVTLTKPEHHTIPITTLSSADRDWRYT